MKSFIEEEIVFGSKMAIRGGDEIYWINREIGF